MQPPNGALVNLPTIYYTTTTQVLHFDVTALGLGVQVTGTPTSYLWHFGDGATASTTSPGHPHPGEDVTHTFSTPAERIAPYVTVVWSGTYTITGVPGTFDVVGSVNRDGAPVVLPVREARSELIGGSGN